MIASWLLDLTASAWPKTRNFPSSEVVSLIPEKVAGLLRRPSMRAYQRTC